MTVTLQTWFCRSIRNRLLAAPFLALLVAAQTNAQIIVSDVLLSLEPPSAASNQLQLNLSAGPLGSDSAVSSLSGNLTTNLGFYELPGGGHELRELTIVSGQLLASDVSFSLLGGFVNAQGTGLGGVPSTISPPSIVVGGEFDASDHELLLNQGMVTAAGNNAFDFFATPIAASGTGIGSISLSPLAPEPGFTVYDLTVSLPIAVDQDFEIPDVPIFGTVNATLTASGVVASLGTVRVPQFGDFDQDGVFGCGDIDLLSSAIRTGSQDLQYDTNGDGTISLADRDSWVTSVVGTSRGDVNLDLVTDVDDFDIWNANRFSVASSWCNGDLTGDGSTDISDFHTWNENRGVSATAVPEPSLTNWMGAIVGLLLMRFAIVCPSSRPE